MLKMKGYQLLYICLLSSLVPCLVGKDFVSNGIDQQTLRPPHIIFIMADDLGWNDVGFHGSNQIPTPNIDALAYSGVIMNKYYVAAICTPSRSALMTGKHPIHTGMQHTVLFGAEPRGLPLTETILPQHLNRLGYESHIVGKWHLGSFRREYTPTFRGFKSHVGYWTGHQDYFDHTAMETGFWGLDMRRGVDPAWNLHGQYSTHVFTNESVQIIEKHNSSAPLFLYIAHAAVHSANPYNPLPAPDSTVAKFPQIDNYNRRRYAAILSELDTSVGLVVEALRGAQMLENSIIVFTTDNGGPADGFNLNAASNWPLRGVKNTLWEGGVRGAGLIWSPRLDFPGRVNTEMFHITDWLPTLYAAAGGNTEDLQGIDGINQWDTIQKDLPSKRKRILHNIDDIYGNAALTIENWKYVEGSTYNGQWDGWYGPSGREKPVRYDVGQILGSRAHRAMSGIIKRVQPDRIRELRDIATVDCAEERRSSEARFSDCKPLISPCLFDIDADPCETNNLAKKYPDILLEMSKELRFENSTAVPPSNLAIDPRGNPEHWDHVWTDFADYGHRRNEAKSLKIAASLEPEAIMAR